jgi:hypothetical protein
MRHLAFRPLEPWIKTLLESTHAKHVNKFLEEKLQLGAVWRSQTQRQYCPVRVGPKTGAMVSTVRPKKQLGEGNPGSVGQSSLDLRSLRSLLLTFLIRVHSCPFVVGSSGSVLRVSAVKYFCPHFAQLFRSAYRFHTDFGPILSLNFVLGHFK